ncbi:MAG: permease, partial [Gammaproteobacteria bacterium]
MAGFTSEYLAGINRNPHPIHEVLQALSVSVAMGWEILWALVLGFTLSGVVQAVVTKGEMSRLLPDARPRTCLLASALGAA